MHNLTLANGFDVRDWLSLTAHDIPNRVEALKKLFEKVVEIPEDWVKGRTKEAIKHGALQLKFVPCSTYAELRIQWEKVMRWIPGLNKTFVVMLATSLSTESIGDQLWIKVVGPPSCLSGNAKLKFVIRDKEGNHINHKGGTLRTLYERFNGFQQTKGGLKWTEGVEFFIQSIDDKNCIVLNKIEGVVWSGYGVTYRLTTLSGKTVDLTEDHEVYTDTGFRPLSKIREGDKVFINPGKVKPKGQQRQLHRKEVLVKYHPRASMKMVNGCTYYRLKVYRAVYEAYKNNMTYGAYIKTLNCANRERIDRLWVVPEGSEIHHKNGKAEDNRIVNLELVESSSQHRLEYHINESLDHIKIVAELDEVVAIRELSRERVYDIICADPYRNFVAGGIVVHNCGKTTLAEAMGVCKKYIYSTDTISKLTSGYQVDRDGTENMSFVLKLNNKTLIIQDGDTLLNSPELPRLLSQFRAFYGRNLRTEYANKMSASHEGINTTVILMGTESLRQLDSSEMGERMLDCVVIREMDEDLEYEIAFSKSIQAKNHLGINANGSIENRDDADMLLAKQMTGGYIEYLRNTGQSSLGNMKMSQEYHSACVHMGMFVSYMRSRPSRKQEETTTREMPFRLVSQFTRLVLCLGVVLNKDDIDTECMGYAQEIAIDTSRGRTYDIVSYLYQAGKEGIESKTLTHMTGHTLESEAKYLSHLKKIGAVEVYLATTLESGKRAKWRLTDRLMRLYRSVVKE